MGKSFKVKNIGQSTIRFLFGSVEPGMTLDLADRYLAKSLALLMPRQLIFLDDRRPAQRKKNHGAADT